MTTEIKQITDLILQAKEKAYKETSNEPEPGLTEPLNWPVECTVGPGLEGAIASETKIGYVNGAKGWLIYRGYDIFDLCAYSTFEEVSYLLIHGSLPTQKELREFTRDLVRYRTLNKTLRLMMSTPIEEMNAMSALRVGVNYMRRELTCMDQEAGRPSTEDAIGSDEDSIPMETVPRGEEHAIYEFKAQYEKKTKEQAQLENACDRYAVYHLISGVATITAAIARIQRGLMPIDPDPELSHAGNFLYMMTGRKPGPVEERIMDIALILHADHGMNASTFASMVVASTLSDIYFSVGAGIAALSGPLHGGANEEVIRMLMKIGSPENVKSYMENAQKTKSKISGFGHRVYKAYDPRARILGPLAAFVAQDNPDVSTLFQTAEVLEQGVRTGLGEKKKIFPNVDFYSGIVYRGMGIAPEIFTPIFAVARVSGWTARVYEYLQNNRIFRPRAMYTGEFNKEYKSLDQR